MSIKVSIITVVRNNLIGLKKTYNSIQSSLGQDVEWVVIDGNSSDGTVGFLEIENSENIRWLSEPDKNMYDAMNKGIKLASGEYLQFLNAGDVLEISIQKSGLLECDKDLVFYNMQKIDINNKLINWSLPLNFLEHLQNYPSVCHQSTIIKKEIFEKFGLYSDNYKYLGDYEFFCRIVSDKSNPISYHYSLDIILVSFICDGVTFNYRLSLDLLKECIKIQKMYFKKIDFNITLMYILKYIISYIPGHLRISNYMRKYIKH